MNCFTHNHSGKTFIIDTRCWGQINKPDKIKLFFIFINPKPIKAPTYGDKLHFQCISLYCYDRHD